MNQLKTYKNDDSFFTTLVPGESSYIGWPIQAWMLKHNVSRFRLIKDDEIDLDRLTMAQVQDIYPGIATIGITMNPWARVVYKFEKLGNLSNEGLTLLQSLFPKLDTNNFESVVKAAFLNPETKNLDIDIFKPQLHWLSQKTDDGIKLPTYIIRGEYTNKDIKVLKDYFCITDNSKIKYTTKKIDHKKYYNTETKKIIETYFKEDIETFGYKF